MSNFDSYSAKFGREDFSRYVKSMSNGSVSSDGPQEAEKILVVHRWAGEHVSRPDHP